MFSEYEQFSMKEKETFTSVANHLLGNTFIIKATYKDGNSLSNPEYNFLFRHLELVRDYLGLLGWRIHHDEYNGFFYVSNDLEANRLTLNSRPTAILLALRLLYDENSDRAGL